MTVQATTPESRPWLCRRHRRAGIATEPVCCRLSMRVADGRERQIWFGIRLDQKPTRLQAGIRATIADPAHGLRVLANHVFDVERSWCWGHAAAAGDTDFDDRSTRNLRII